MSGYKLVWPQIDFDAWVHPSVKDDRLARERHVSYIRSQALGGALAAIVFSAYFMLIAGPTAIALLAFICFLAPAGIAWYLSRTGELDIAYFLSAANLTALVCLVAVFSGGVSSFAVVWLVLVPLEGALSADRKVMIWSTVLAGSAFLALHVGTGVGAFPQPATFSISISNLTVLSTIAAAAYAFGLAVSIQNLHRSTIAELQISRENYRLIAQNTSDLITRHEADGSLSFASLASRDLFGVMPEELIAQGFGNLLQQQDTARFRAAITKCAVSGKPLSVEFFLSDRAALGASDTGTARQYPLWVEMRCRPLARGNQGGGRENQPTSVLAVTRDISLQKAREAGRLKALDAAEGASRAKTLFIATMSHELRTPLNAIIGFSEFLHRELLINAREPKQAEYCRIIHESGEHLLSVVNDLLDVSKIEAGKLEIITEPFEMSSVARDVVEIMRVEADKKSLDLVIEEADDLPELVADRRACKQILLNLMSNACKFTQQNGIVTLSMCQRDDNFEISVSDTGIGIAEKDLAKLGEAFFQVESSYSRKAVGSGLGLSIVNGMAQLHGGSMHVESTLGSGTTVTIRLPNDILDDSSAEKRMDAQQPVAADNSSSLGALSMDGMTPERISIN